MDDPSHDKKTAAAYLKISVRSLEQMMHDGTGPRFYKPPGMRIIRCRQSDLDAWAADQPSFTSTSQAAKAVS